MPAWLILETCGSLRVEAWTRQSKHERKTNKNGNGSKQINPLSLFPAASMYATVLSTVSSVQPFWFDF